MNHSLGIAIESLVAVLLMLTIGYCMLLNKRLQRLKADEHSLKATIAELITATEIAERAIGGLKHTVRDVNENLGNQLTAAAQISQQLKKQLVSRPTTYLLGQVDTLPLGGFDSSCPAMAQGATRRARGEAFVKYITEQLGAKHAIQIVPECGHNDRCVYTTDSVLPLIFPK